MNANLLTWEKPLLDWAHEGLEAKGEHTAVACDADRLAAAYDRCEEITREHSRTFYLASGLLSPEKRRAARALYAFCRVTDDLIDHGGGDGLTRLIEWRRCALSIPPGDDPVALAWADTRAHYRIPQAYPEQLIAGVARDATAGRYETFADLAAYCYGVASTVGLMAMHIIGYAGREAIPYAVKTGGCPAIDQHPARCRRGLARRPALSAAGRTERLRFDGRGYRPRRVDARWRAFMQFQIARTRQFYAEAMPGIALLDASGRFAIAAAAERYRAILDDIEAHDYDVFSRRAHVNTIGKLVRLPGIWRRSRQNKPAAYA